MGSVGFTVMLSICFEPHLPLKPYTSRTFVIHLEVSCQVSGRGRCLKRSAYHCCEAAWGHTTDTLSLTLGSWPTTNATLFLGCSLAVKRVDERLNPKGMIPLSSVTNICRYIFTFEGKYVHFSCTFYQGIHTGSSAHFFHTCQCFLFSSLKRLLEIF